MDSDTVLASAAYVLASLLTFEVLSPLQNVFFPEYSSKASLLFLPHGVRVLAAWLLGWRAVPALLPGVFIVFAYMGGADVFLPSRLWAIFVAVISAPAVFHGLKLLGWDLFPQPGRKPCWACVMVAGTLASVLLSVLTNAAFGSPTEEYVAYLIGDISGLFFLMLGLLFAFRYTRAAG
ncbi:hypothetical protein FGK63_18700 [Ruegeria sediminis]|uniref:MASE1 domain-containing protein n=1 Tax=Ruegeria sediminis TaxID=2583820 RepID=A0ABY2WTV0_9RHOB|nr:hypothetical protein FGK63_18700 [Ruegeria sediminis]